MTLKLEDGTALVERFGAWSVYWRAHGFFLPETGDFTFSKIILPLEIYVDDAARGLGDLVVTLESSFRFEILLGAPLVELERFKKRASAEVLAAVGTVGHSCFDCAKDAGWSAVTWTAGPCPGCRAPYCKNANCLRRLEASPIESQVCKNCGEAVGA